MARDGGWRIYMVLLVVLFLEVCLGHLIGCPENMLVNVQWTQRPVYESRCNTYQQIAVLGMVEMIRGRMPRKKPAQPNWRLMIPAAFHRPRADRTSSLSASPRVWRRVLTTSRGVVIPAAKAPAKPPAMQWVKGS